MEILVIKQILPFMAGAVLPPLLLFNSQLITTRQSPQQQIPPSPTIVPTQLPTITPTHTNTPSPTLTPTPKPTRVPTPTQTPTPLPTSVPVTSQQLEEWFSRYSSQYSVDRQRLWLIAVCESDLRPNAKNGDYGGMYQFSSSTWKSTRARMNESTDPALRYNPEEAIKSAAFLLSTRGHDPWPNCTK